LSNAYNLHPNTIRKIIHQIPTTEIKQQPRPASLIMDTTYFKQADGLLVVIDPNASSGMNKTVYYAFLSHTETTLDYETAADTIEAMGYSIISITIDGRRGVKGMLEDRGIPVQYCQFHQLQTINQCLTRNPILTPHRELRDIALTLTGSDKATFESRLDRWHLKHGVWLRERYVDETGRRQYKHARCRRAYFSLRRNLPNLFTYQQPDLQEWSKHGVSTRNTTSPLDGYFGNLKDKLRVHRGITKTLKNSLIRVLLSEVAEIGGN